MGEVETLKGLRDQVRAAKGHDWRLDEAMFAVSRGWSIPLHGAAKAEFERLAAGGEFTDSVDAALRLVADELPRWSGQISFGLMSTAWLWNADSGDRTDVEVGANRALALCAALLSALIAQAEQGAPHGE